MKPWRGDCLPKFLRVGLVNGKIHMNVKNTGQGQNIGIVELRSVGYFHIMKDSIQRCLCERFISLTEEEEWDYFLHMQTHDDKKLQMNTRIAMRKTPTDETQNSPGLSKYSKYDTGKRSISLVKSERP